MKEERPELRLGEPQFKETESEKILRWFSCVVLAIAAITLIIAAFSSCTTTKYIPVQAVKTEYKTNTDTVREHELLHDSIFYSIETKGDTVFKNIDRWHNREVVKWKSGTVYVNNYDSIPYPVIQSAKTVVEKYPFLSKARIAIIAFALGFVVCFFRKVIWDLISKVIKIINP